MYNININEIMKAGVTNAKGNSLHKTQQRNKTKNMIMNYETGTSLYCFFSVFSTLIRRE